MQQADDFLWSDGGNDAFEMIAAQQPDRCDIQLLRSFAHPGLKLGGYAHEHVPGFVEIGIAPAPIFLDTNLR